MKHMQTIYERASISSTLEPNEHYFQYYDQEQNKYISIPKEDVSEKEQQLLAHFYVPVEQEGGVDQLSEPEQAWKDFLRKEAPCPTVKADRVRFIHVELSEDNRPFFYEAVDTFFDHALLVVWMNERKCILIEEKSDYEIKKEDAQTFLDVLAGDFYLTGRLFIGRFTEASEELRAVYSREAEMARKAVSWIPEQRVTTVEMVIPHLFLAESRTELSKWFASEKALFEADDDLRKTLQLFIQNNLNASQTAKQLHLHRNSLQYRIDRFADRTGIDVRSYEGALLVYMICLMSTKKN